MFQMEQRINSRYDVGSDNGVINVSQELLPRGDSFNQSDFLQFSSSGAGEGGYGGLDDLEIPLIFKNVFFLIICPEIRTKLPWISINYSSRCPRL